MAKQKFYPIWFSLICIFMFILQSNISGFTELFLMNQQAIPQVWRFITSIFLHGGIGHLAYNLFALILFGLLLEKFIGSKNFFIVFFSSGILAGIFSYSFYPSSLGASGAILGIIGALAVVKPLMTIFAFGMIMPMFVAAILWAIGDLLGFLYADTNVGYVAHLSGIAVGFVFGLLFRINNKKLSKGDSVSFSNKLVPEKEMRDWEDYYMK